MAARRRATTSLWVLVCLAGSAAQLPAQPGSLVIENQFLRISVFADKGALNEIVHRPSRINLRSKTAGAFRQIWSMNVSAPDGTTFQAGSANATTFSGKAVSSGGSRSLDLTWQGLQPAGRAPMRGLPPSSDTGGHAE